MKLKENMTKEHTTNYHDLSTFDYIYLMSLCHQISLLLIILSLITPFFFDKANSNFTIMNCLLFFNALQYV